MVRRGSAWVLLFAGVSSISGCARGTGFLTDEIEPIAPPEHAAPPIEAASDASPPSGAEATPGLTSDGYPPGTIATLAFDAIDDAHTEILLYTAGATSAAPGAKLEVPTPPGGIASLAFDADRRLYALDYSGRVQIFRSGAVGLEAPERVVAPGGLYPTGGVSGAEDLAIDRAGRIYVAVATQADHAGPNGVLVFDANASGDAPPARFVRGPHTGLALPIAVGLDDADHLFVGDYAESRVEVFASDADGDVAPMRTACATYGFGAMTVAPDGRVFVSPEGTPAWSVRIYEPFDGASQPLAGVLQGPHTGLDETFAWPIKMGVDPEGGLVTISPTGGLIYAENAAGDAPPTSRFAGWNALAVAPRDR